MLPDRYVLHLTPFIIPDNFTIKGRASIEIDMIAPTDTVTLHIRDMKIVEDSVAVTGTSGTVDYSVVGHGYDQARDFYHIK